jgi:murein DD-endopeptidase MepM/ murein hydrolase activator NlpD
MKVLRHIIVSSSFVLFFCGFFTEAKAQNVPATNVPAGFGRYCSVTYPGGWALRYYSPANSDPCKDLPGGKIERAGLWSISKNNNVLRTCDGDVGIYRGIGGDIIKTAYDQAANKKNCIFTIAPTAIHVFDRPYVLLPGENHATPNVFDFDVYNKPLKSTDFGQPANSTCSNGTFIDRKGRQLCNNREQAYDWGLKKNTPIVSVAAGIVREERWREVDKQFGCGTDKQGEIYVEHKVGTGEYAERFVTYYAHMNDITVKKNQTVTRGQVIGTAGATGCVSPPDASHLHFSVFRTTNLSGYRKWDLTYPDKDYGVSSIRGVIDPFGWDAPKQIDPWAWAFLGSQNDPYEGAVMNPGAFSIYLWRSGQAPPTTN